MTDDSPTPTRRRLPPIDTASVLPDQVSRAALARSPRHGLWHTYASIELQGGTHPKIVQERLGHASIAITTDTHSHVLRQLDAEAATTTASLVESRVG